VSPSNWAFGIQNIDNMSTDTFIKINQSRIQNIDGCLTADANITILQPNGKLAFYYFEDGKLIRSNEAKTHVLD
jgi:hypothetical protein